MKAQTLQSIADFAGAKLAAQDPQARVQAISIDTRTLDPGDVYMPIIGERLDGHVFIDQAFEKGALASFSDAKHRDSVPKEGNYLFVEDTNQAFARLAANYRASLSAKFIGITGSNGKTTTKDILHSILQRVFKTKKTTGNLNNEIGVPRTLLQIDEDTDVAVVEMGMSAFGEMAALTKMVRPDIAVITNVGDVHLEALKTRENVAKAKLEILQGMTQEGLLLYNRDNPTLHAAVQTMEVLPRMLSYGTSPKADYRLELVSSSVQGSRFLVNGEAYTINLLGEYQMYNAAAAILIAKELGLSQEEIQKGLFVEDPTRWRSELVHFHGFDMLVDLYKSNPPSLREALRTSALFHGYSKKIAILGDMLELGPQEKEIHRMLGREISPQVFDALLFIGPLSRYMMEGAAEHFSPGQLFYFENKRDLVDQAKNLIEPNSFVLIKASRALRLEEVVESLSIVTAND